MLIGISGKKQSGKDTFADYLVNEFKFKKMSFADPLKGICQRVFGLSIAQVTDNEAKETPIKWPIADFEDLVYATEWAIDHVIAPNGPSQWPFYKRDDLIRMFVYQTCDVFWPCIHRPLTPRLIMQLYGTEVGRHLFPDIWIRLFRQRARQYDNVVVSDVRFDNEANAMTRHGQGKTVKIIRPGLGPTDGHSSETKLEDMITDLVIHNDGSLEQYMAKVKEASKVLFS